MTLTATPFACCYRLFMLLCLLVLGGCVTEMKGNRQVDKNKSLDLHIRLAESYVSQGNRESARLHLGKAFDIDKRSPEATSALAKLYELEGEPKLAEETFRKALRLKKSFTSAQNSLGIFLFTQKRYEEALAQFEAAATDLAYIGRAEV